jgi:D-sedoheptulose 7-phosphate isomerase
MDGKERLFMTTPSRLPSEHFTSYAVKLHSAFTDFAWTGVADLAAELKACWEKGRKVMICGNGGSAANAMHLANDFLYGISKSQKPGLRVMALCANSSVLTCLANDEGYEHIFSLQIAVHGQPGDVLIAMSGSGNSPNILQALAQARTQGVKSYAILGYTGGKAKAMADVAIHFPIDDMQISEDLQLVIGHMIMQWLKMNRPDEVAP